MKTNTVPNNIESYAPEFSEDSFWTKVKTCARAIGAALLEEALVLYYAWRDPEMPVWAKAAIISALGYLVCPVDAIPDVIPVIGYTDDAGVLAAVIAMLNVYLKEEHRQHAQAVVEEWFD